MWRCRRAGGGSLRHGFDCLAEANTAVSQCIALLVTALMLAGCCASGNGCAPASGAPVAWDGLGSAPTSDSQPVELRPDKPARTKREIILGPLETAATEANRKIQPKDQWEQEQTADQAEEVRLKRKLIICSACSAGESARDDAAGSTR
jgi:hypothetical protein